MPSRAVTRSPRTGPDPEAAEVRRERGLALVSPLLMLAIWEVLVRAGWLDARFFPAPSGVAGTFWSLVVSGELLRHLLASLGRIGAGFVLGAVPALVLGVLMSTIPVLRAALNPVFAATFPIPKIAILPLILILFGLGEASKIVVIAVAVFYLVLFNTMAGVLGIPRIYADVGRSFGAGRLRALLTIALPGALPMIFTGFKLGGGVALLVITAAEFVGARAGLGALIWDSWQTFSIERMFVGLVVISALGYAISLALDELQRRCVPWRY